MDSTAAVGRSRFALGTALIIVGMALLAAAYIGRLAQGQRDAVLAGLRDWALRAIMVTEHTSLLSEDVQARLGQLGHDIVELRKQADAVLPIAEPLPVPAAEATRLASWVSALKTTSATQGELRAVLRDLVRPGSEVPDADAVRQFLKVKDTSSDASQRLRGLLQSIHDRTADASRALPPDAVFVDPGRLVTAVSALDRWHQDARDLREAALQLRNDKGIETELSTHDVTSALALSGLLVAGAGLLSVMGGHRAARSAAALWADALALARVEGHASAGSESPSADSSNPTPTLSDPGHTLQALHDRLLMACDRVAQWLSSAEAAASVDADAIIEQLAERSLQLALAREALLNQQLQRGASTVDTLGQVLSKALDQRLLECMSSLSELRRIVDGDEAEDGESMACVAAPELEALHDHLALTAMELHRFLYPLSEPEAAARGDRDASPTA